MFHRTGVEPMQKVEIVFDFSKIFLPQYNSEEEFMYKKYGPHSVSQCPYKSHRDCPQKRIMK